MNRNSEIVVGIYLVQAGFEFDLHNNFNFKNPDYSVEKRKLVLNWERSEGDWVSPETPKTFRIEFCDVSDFPFMPSYSETPFTDDACVNSSGTG